MSAYQEAYTLRERLQNPTGWWLSACDDGSIGLIRRRDDLTLRISRKWLKDHGYDLKATLDELRKRIAAAGCDSCCCTGFVTTETHGTIPCPDCGRSTS